MEESYLKSVTASKTVYKYTTKTRVNKLLFDDDDLNLNSATERKPTTECVFNRGAVHQIHFPLKKNNTDAIRCF